MRADSLARKLQNNNHYDFWKEVRVMNNCKTSLTSNIEGACGPDKTADVWCEHYYNLFNCVQSKVVVVENVDLSENMVVRSHDVYDAIMMPDNTNDGWLMNAN